jgi:hypothetical protein
MTRGHAMLFVHDSYVVIGEREFDFEDAVREGYAAAVADDNTRLLWYLHSVHGSAEGYLVVMLTAVRDGAAWERLAQRLRYGDLASYALRIGAMRYRANSVLLVRADWADLPGLDLAAVPVADVDHPTALFREDILEGRGINSVLAEAVSRPAQADDVLTFEAAFQPALDSDTAARIMYRIPDNERFTAAWRTVGGWGDWSGSLTPDLPNGVRGESRYLRSARWSPMS